MEANQQKFRVAAGKKVRLKNYDSVFTGTFKGETEAEGKIRKDCESLASYQDKLPAEERQSLLLVFQIIDGAGNEGAANHVMSSVEP